MYCANSYDRNSLTLHAQPDSGRGMLVVIDPSVADYQFLAAGVLPGAETIVLEPSRDAIAQITMALARHREHRANSLHIVCHGAPGKLYLGKTCLSADNLAPYRQQLLEWGVAEILLYSCELAAGKVGTAFVGQLSRLTGADIAASPRRVGNGALGGSWHLESYCGEVSAGLAFVPDVVREYSGVFASFDDATNFDTGTGPSFLTLGDFNGDGIPDIVTANVLGNNISVLLADGTGNFGSAANFSVGSLPSSVAVGDFNSDGDLDIAATNSGSNNVSVLLGDGSGSFGAAVNFNVGTGPATVAVGDFNGDGQEDLVTANASSNNVSLLLGNGSGSFGAAANFDVGTSLFSIPFSVAVGDFNGDNDLDVVTANSGTNNVSVLLGDGFGSFGAASNFNVGTFPTSVAVGDLDADGHLDLVTANASSNNVSLLLGDGLGSFGAAANFDVGTEPRSVAVEDFDADGNLDLAVANGISNNVSVLLGDGAGSFASTTDFGVGNAPRSVAVEDFNGDGKSDIATANVNSNNVSVLLNTTDGNPSLPIDPETGVEYKPGEIVLKFNSGVTEAQIQTVAQSYGAIAVEDLVPDPNSDSPLERWKILKFAPDADLLQIRADLRQDASVEAIELNYYMSLAALPNDSDFGQLWGLHNTGQNGGTPDADIDAPEAWECQKGSHEVVVAVIDSGIDYSHPDLAANIWTNPNEPANDSLGYINDIRGWDFVDWDNDPMDEYGHGTHVAGIIGAEGNNNQGVVGVNHNVSLMPLKVTDSNGDRPMAPLDLIVKAIEYAVDNDADVINASFGGKVQSFSLFDSIAFASANNVPVVVPAGNGDASGVGMDIDDSSNPDVFPAEYPHSNIIAVAATDRNDQLATFSNYGTNNPNSAVDIAAPGVDIWSTLPGNNYGSKDGTSMAAAYVSGAAALLLAQDPSLNPTDLKNILMDNADDKSSLQGKMNSEGRLNLYNSLKSLNNPPIVNNSVFYQNVGYHTGNQFSFVQDSYTDPDPNDSITYSIALANTLDWSWYTGANGVNGGWYRKPKDGVIFPEIPIPSWLTFDPVNRTINIDNSSRPSSFQYGMKITATDKYGATASEFVWFKSSSHGGFIVDGYIAGSTVFLDANKNGVLDAGEPSAITDNTGEFDLDVDFNIFDTNGDGKIDPDEGSLVAIGGTDTATQLPLETPLTATPDATIVTLLTSLVADLVEDGFTVEDANAKVTTALSIPDSVPLNHLDPITTTRNDDTGGVETFTAMVQTQNFITQTMSLISGVSEASNGEIVKEIVAAMNSQIKADVILDLGDSTMLETMVLDVATRTGVDLSSVVSQAVQIMAQANQRISNIAATTPTNLIETEFAKEQKISLGTEASDLKALAAGTNTIGGSLSFDDATNFDTGTGPSFVAAGDFNSDGIPDLVTANVLGNNISVLLADGTGNFGSAANFSVGSLPSSVAVGDFNSDGDLDIAATNSGSNNVSVLLGDGSGSFGAAVNFNVGTGPATVAVGDFNGDGQEDLVTANASSNNISLLLGDGSGSFGAAANFDVGTSLFSIPFSVAVGDFNGDNDLDLVTANSGTNNVSVLLGDGFGSFTAASNFNFNVGTFPTSVAVGDLDADGHLDLVTANASSNNVSLLLGDGSGSFGAAANFDVGTEPRSVAVEDFDADGNLDLAVANGISNNVSVLLGDGAGSFADATEFGVGDAPRSVAVEDFNGDGKSDIATANVNSNNVSVLLNTTDGNDGNPSLPVDPETGVEYKPGEIVVKFNSGVTEAQIQTVAQSYGAIAVEDLVPSERWKVLSFAPDADLLQIRADLRQDASVEAIEFNYLMSLAAVPNDSDFGQLWGLHNTGQSGGTLDADIDAPEAWDIQTGDSGVVVAVIDTGIDYNHPDLTANISSIPGDDFVDPDNDPMDEHGHGTHVAGIIGAEGDNGTGVVGVNHNVSLMPLKVTDASGKAYSINFFQAINYAVNNGADVINASLGVEFQSDVIFDTLALAQASGVLVVVPAGNGDSSGLGMDLDDNSNPDVFPAEYPHSNLIAVAATDRDDKIATFSNYGTNQVDIAAPGVDIWSTLPSGSYGSKYGTSMATAYVSGAAALLLAEYPNLKGNPEQLKNILMMTADPLHAMDQGKIASGRLDLYDAITNNPPELTHPPLYWQGWQSGTKQQGETFIFAANTFIDPDGDSLTYEAHWLEGVPKYGWKGANQNGVFHLVPNNWDAESPLPANIIEFNPANRTFTIKDQPAQDTWIRVRATDKYGEFVDDYFHIFPSGTGTGIDNYIAGGTAFFDANKNGVLDAGEPFGFTNDKGEFNFDIDLETFDANDNGVLDPGEGSITIVGGTDIATGLALVTPISATPNSFFVTMLTSVLAELVDRGLTEDEAQTELTESLLLPNDLPILSEFDPVAATESNEESGAEVFTGMIQVQNTVTLIGSLLDGASSSSLSELTKSVVGAIASKIQANESLDLGAAATLEPLIQDAVNQALAIDPNIDINSVLNIDTQVAQVIAESNQRIADAAANNTGADITKEVARVQKISLGETTADLKEVTAGTKTIVDVVAENTGAALDDKIANAQVYSAAPTDLELSSTTVEENQPIGTEVGTFSTIDPDAGETHTYSLVPGAGDTDNDSFEIVNNSLQTSETFDYETKDAYNIRVQTTDGNGGVYWEQFTINVSDVALENSGGSLSFDATGFNNFNPGTGPSFVAAGDFDSDGIPDLVTANVLGNNITVLLADGTGNFSSADYFSVGSLPSSVAVGDFNSDGDLDVAATNSGSNNVSVLLGDGSGSFGAAANFDVGTGPATVAVGDFNGDGQEDLVTANASSNNVSLLLGDGSGSFSAAANFDVGTSLFSIPFSVAVGDFNGDSNLDVVTANSGTNNVSVLLGDGSGSFGAASNLNVGTFPTSVAVGDLDADGNLDLVTANASSNNVSLLLGDGSGSFGAAVNFDVGTEPRSVAVEDFDADGNLDLAVANGISNNVSVLLGDGSGSFADATEFGVGDAPRSVAVEDFNGDGKSDIATANVNSNNVSVLLNTTTNAIIIGTNGNDNLNGSKEDDTINGLAGNDKLYGDNGDDSLNGDDGDDRLYGQRGNDTLNGGAGRDELRGHKGNDVLNGGDDNDKLYGLGDNDLLIGGKGKDKFFGGLGNDELIGDNGSDTLTGAEPTTGGVGEIDTLTGGNGVDWFILGDVINAYYNDGDDSDSGLGDYAEISDFDPTKDKIQLHGVAADYVLSTSPGVPAGSTGIFRKTSGVDELVGIVIGSTNTAEIEGAFSFV